LDARNGVEERAKSWWLGLARIKVRFTLGDIFRCMFYGDVGEVRESEFAAMGRRDAIETSEMDDNNEFTFVNSGLAEFQETV